MRTSLVAPTAHDLSRQEVCQHECLALIGQRQEVQSLVGCAFISPSLANVILHCILSLSLEYGSDQYPRSSPVSHNACFKCSSKPVVVVLFSPHEVIIFWRPQRDRTIHPNSKSGPSESNGHLRRWAPQEVPRLCGELLVPRTIRVKCHV